MNASKRRRITMKLRTPNPLFEKWIIEWRNKAKEENSKMEFCFSKALQSLRRYPVPLERGSDCKILKGFGDKICSMIDKKLKEHKKLQGNTLDNTLVGNVPTSIESDVRNELRLKKLQSGTISGNSLEQKRLSKKCKIQDDSVECAILLMLYKKTLVPSYSGYLTNSEVIQESESLINKSFTKSNPSVRNITLSSIKTLTSKNLIAKQTKPVRFSLTHEGLILARTLFEKGKKDLPNDELQTDFFTTLTTERIVSDVELKHVENKNIDSAKNGVPIAAASKYSSCTLNIANINDNNLPSILLMGAESSKRLQKHTSDISVASSVQSSSEEECVIFPPDSYDIILYVDTCETSGSNINARDEPILTELQRLLVPYEVKNLKVGDYIWICRDKITKKELVLPYIIERKRMDDLGKSIKDGRYHEQKFRLKKSGIQNIIYLIEKYGNNQHVGLPIATLDQAVTNTAVQDDFCIKYTENTVETAKYLAHFSLLLVKMYKSKTIASCPKENLVEISPNDLIFLMSFKEFNQSSCKNKPLKVSDLFVKMLLQIKGVSVDKALAIVREYPTPTDLRNAYKANGVNGEKLLAQIQFGDYKKTIGQVPSKTIYQLFTMHSF